MSSRLDQISKVVEKLRRKLKNPQGRHEMVVQLENLLSEGILRDEHFFYKLLKSQLDNAKQPDANHFKHPPEFESRVHLIRFFGSIKIYNVIRGEGNYILIKISKY